ncbi:helix-turn-helix domain-containing protein [Mucilaginibacter sp. X4EP1]|uniref:helix-turn-helix domain-containing protein n=1 Tax=Mucilaginibacter sp. X4EP1 TaxID=2723092 RepID=UPI00216702F1|nr:AraC family transcriptional regulator [Mucilaginibacter sp. X4EP1]MCS3816392.1 AraC-like DNA-binding protein [Mucilaginibacter sp. X4EP1]
MSQSALIKDIPIHQLNDREKSGIGIKFFKKGDVPKEAETLGAHRDDHYIFFLMEAGTASLMIDFNEMFLTPASIYYILPGQVHYRIRNAVSAGWFVAVDPLLVPSAFRDVFEDHLLLQKPVILNEEHFCQCKRLLCLLEEKHRESDENPFYNAIVHSLLKSFLGMAASYFSCTNHTISRPSRPAQLSQAFKKLLVSNVKEIKSPSEYAARLNISESYLNEALKKITGFTVSYWITQEVMMEAKRLLYYSSLTVKEIAHALGYEDHAYFSRLFKRATGVTALEFRMHYHK